MIIFFGCAYYIVKEFEEAAFESSLPRSWGAWFNNDTSWQNKYKWGKIVANRLGFGKRLFTELFRSPLVFLTDATHAFQLLKFLVLASFVAYLSEPITAAYFMIGILLGGVIKELFKFGGIKYIR
jgi:hypothetical protein